LCLALKRAIREKHYTHCLKIQDSLCDVLSFTLRNNLEIDFVIKLDAIEHIKEIFNNTKLLNFNSIKVAQQAFDNLSLRRKYNRCRFKYAKRKT